MVSTYRVSNSIPNALSVLRICLSIVLFVLLVVPHALVLAQWIFAVALVTDKLDGSIARWIGAESDLGKRLESLADPFFGLASVLYVVVQLDFPHNAFLFGMVFFAVATAIRFTISIRKKRLFYLKSPITRYGVGLIYLVLVFYFFQLPHREWLVWPILAYGVVGFANYLRLMAQFYRKPSM